MTNDPLAPLSTDPDDFCFIDVETRSTKNVTVHGAFQHTLHGRVTILVYAIGDEPVKEWVLTDWSPGKKLSWARAPSDLLAFLDRARRQEAWFVAWNAGFEICAFRRAMTGLGFQVEWIIDAMVQATRSHLPADLMGASLVAKVQAKKQTDGKRLIKMFADESLGHTPQTDPEDWEKFIDYARDDVNSMREIFWGTMPLSRREWEAYWCSERINQRGIPMDVTFVRGAAALAEYASSKANEDITRLTGDADITKVTQAARLVDWVRAKLVLLPEVDRILTREILEEPGEDGEDVRQVPKYSLERTRVEELIAYLERMDEEQGLTDDEFAALQVLEVRLYGASATPMKFKKALLALDDDSRLKGQYVFAGAAATTRFSSRGIQCVTGDHEVLTRDGWVLIKDAPQQAEIMTWNRDMRTMQWGRAEIGAFGPAEVFDVNGTIIKGCYTADHRIPQLNWKGEKFRRDICPSLVRAQTGVATNLLAHDPVDQPDAPFSDEQLRLLVAMQSDGSWAKKAVTWHFAKLRKAIRLKAILDRLSIPVTHSRWGDNTIGMRINTGDVPEWLVKDFGPWVLSLSARQALLILEEYKVWDGWTHSVNATLMVSSARQDQMQWLQTIAALAGRTATLQPYTVKKNGYVHWRLYLRNSVTTCINPEDVNPAGVQDVFCPTVPSGYWLCRYGGRVYITGNTHNLSRATIGRRDDELDAIEMIAELGEE